MSVRFLRVVGLLVLAGTISGCSLWPYTREEWHFEGLGDSPIGHYLRGETFQFHFTDTLKADLSQLITDWAEWRSANRLSREYAEALGMRCAPAPETECIYSGEAWSQVIKPGVLPRGRRVFNIEVRLSYLQPQSLVVDVRQRDVDE